MKYIFDGNWKFLEMPVDTSFEKAMENLESFMPVDVPHDWLIYDSTELYRDGTGFYYKEFVWTDTDRKAFLTFDGIYMDSRVYVNGKEAGVCKYGYTTFTLDITGFLKEGVNKIAVSALFKAPNSRWYSGAGIYRHVWLHIKENTFIPENGIYVSTEETEKGFKLYVDTLIKGEAPEEAEIELELFNRERERIEMFEPCAIRKETPEGIRSDGCYLCKNVKRWSPEEPYLYTLSVRLKLNEAVLQEEKIRIGFRTAEFNHEKGFFLNHKYMKLQGVCEHFDLGALGSAFNTDALRRRFIILKDMGVNAIRCSHGMASPEFIDLADEIGFLIISEAFDMWERSKTPYDYARFFPEWKEWDVERWICRDRNHPSVILWSIGNEIYDTHADAERGPLLTGQLKGLVEKWDYRYNGRTTIASNYMPWENAGICADIVGIAGYNYAEKHYEKHHKEHPERVIYGSETSSIVASRGIYHFPLSASILSDDDGQCSALGNSPTSWGAKSMEDCVTVDRDIPWSLGQFIWTGFDYLGEPTPYHSKNSYFGQSDTAGFPKDSYYVWKSAWTDYKKKPMIHIFPYWDFNPGQLVDVRVCSNAPEVELFLNGRSLGKKTLNRAPGSGKRIIADYRVPYEKGILRAEAYSETGEIVETAERHSFGDSVKICLKADKRIIHAGAEELIFVEISTEDMEGNPVENAVDRVFVDVSGAGRLVGLDNGDSTDYDSMKGVSKRLFSGKLLAVIAPADSVGEIHVKVRGRGLEAAEAKFTCEKGTLPPLYNEKISHIEKNKERNIVSGKEFEIPVRRITIEAEDGQVFSKEQTVLYANIKVFPAEATDKAVEFRAVDNSGNTGNLVTLSAKDGRVKMTALGDGEFRLRATSKSGTENIRIISELEYRIEGLGTAYKNPYDFIAGSMYSSCEGEVSNGNERGVATARDGITRVTYSGLDFGEIGSDEITIPIFTLTGEPYPIEIWEGIPGREGAELLIKAVYQKESRYNVYQHETWKLKRRIKRNTEISFVAHAKMHIKGFSFRKYEKSELRLFAVEADMIYGDSYRICENSVKGIGNNVSLIFKDMNFGEDGISGIRILGKSGLKKNTIHIKFSDGEKEEREIIEFAGACEWTEREFELSTRRGTWEVTFIFLPGSDFDFKWFEFF